MPEKLNYDTLIIENVGQALTAETDGANGTVLTGVCAVFGQRNNNRRVYEKEEYLPHLSYLNKQISQNSLTGDLDHPAQFDVTLKSASHLITELRHDGQDRVFIKLRLLENMPNGRLAKALMDGGVRLSISSRAAGKVNESTGYVKLQRIFTYDLVGEPGFTEAVLRQAVNENLKNNFEMITESYNHLREASIVRNRDLVDISESLNYAENFKIYRINNANSGLGRVIEDSSIVQKNGNKMEDFVTRGQMDAYSEILKKQFSAIRKEIGDNRAVLESKGANGVQDTKLVEHINYLAEQLEGVINFTDYLSKKMNESIKYTEHVATKSNESIENNVQYSNYLAEKVTQTIGHQDHITKKLNEAINYVEYVKENLNKSIKYQGYLAEELDRSLQYSEYVAEGSNRAIEFGEYLAENINMNRDYAQYLAERTGQLIGYTEYIAESVQTTGTPMKRNLLSGVDKIDESVSIDLLIEKVDMMISDVNDKSSKAVLENRHPFLKVMSDDNRKKFYDLDKDMKVAIVETLNGSLWFKEADVIAIMEAVIADKTKDIPTFVRFIPNEYKETFGKMNENEKTRLFNKANLYTLNTPYQVKAFWDELDLRGINERVETEKSNNKLTKLNESQSPEGTVPVVQIVEQMRGYSQDYLDSLTRQADYRK